MLKKRRGPPIVTALIHDGIKYERDGMNKVVATKVGGDSNEILWNIPIYTITYDPHLEKDVQDVWINSLSIDVSENCLVVKTERDGVYHVNLLTQTISTIRAFTSRRR